MITQEIYFSTLELLNIFFLNIKFWLRASLDGGETGVFKHGRGSWKRVRRLVLRGGMVIAMNP